MLRPCRVPSASFSLCRFSAVTVLGGDSELARPVVDALRRERYEPARFRGRPVAVSIYRLISRMEVWGT